MTRNNPPISLLDAWGDWDIIKQEGGGIFDNLAEQYNTPWYEQVVTISEKSLDYDYFGNHSGNKKCSTLVYSLMGSDTTLNSESKQILIKLIHDKFYFTWTALWQTYVIGISDSYHPLRNFDITETGSRSKNGSVESTNSKNDTISKGGNDKTTTTYTDSGSENNNRFGFNSSEAVPTEGSINSASGNSTVTKITTDNDTIIGKEETSREETEEGSYSKQFSGTKDVIKADIIKKEREIWVTQYFDTVFSDVDSVLTSMIYNRTHRPMPYYYFPFGYNNI